ncbi:MAG: peptide chain release factor N(5)-glutamine methyltransferase [Gemmatimonadales bacterium]
MPETATRASLAHVLALAAERLRRSGVGDGPREAAQLWAAIAGTTPGDVWLHRDRAAPEGPAARFREAVERRASGMPFAYAVGRVSFRTLDLTLDPRALIPRPETEGLVDLVLDWCLRGKRATENVRRGGAERGGWGMAADVGTGCGCIALALATEGRFHRVIAVERSPDAAALARENVALVRPAVPVEVREGDLLAPLAGERCRVVVANPPYLTEAEYGALDPAVREFEPRAALVSGADGLADTRAILERARGVLNPGGLVALEIDERRARAVRRLGDALGWRVTVHDDLFGRARYALAREES